MVVTHRDYFFSREFAAFTQAEQIVIILDNLGFIYDLQPSRMSDNQRDYITTLYLRSNCGCPTEILDESTGEMISISTHDRGCLRVRFPINEDLSDRTIRNRARREVSKDHRALSQIEEHHYA